MKTSSVKLSILIACPLLAFVSMGFDGFDSIDMARHYAELQAAKEESLEASEAAAEIHRRAIWEKDLRAMGIVDWTYEVDTKYTSPRVRATIKLPDGRTINFSKKYKKASAAPSPVQIVLMECPDLMKQKHVKTHATSQVPTPAKYSSCKEFVAAYTSYKLEAMTDSERQNWARKLGGINEFNRENKKTAERIWNSQKH